jgi:hypothetical protein
VAVLVADVRLPINEARMLDLDDVRWELGPVRQAERPLWQGISPPRPQRRLVPLINGAGRSLQWFIEDLLGPFDVDPKSLAWPLFPAERKNIDGTCCCQQSLLTGSFGHVTETFEWLPRRQSCMDHDAREAVRAEGLDPRRPNRASSA